MSTAPAPILSAALKTLSRATLLVRNSTYPGNDTSIEALHTLGEAIHDVPNLLLYWDEKNLEEIKLSFGVFDQSLWPEDTVPDLLSFFEEELKEEITKENK